MRRWLKIAVPMGIAAVLVAVLAIGFGSPGSDAAQCTQPGPFEGTASSSVTYTFDFCGGDDWAVQILLTWRNSRNDLEMTVVQPDGTTTLNDGSSNFEYFAQQAPLQHGIWTVTVTNPGSGHVKFGLEVNFSK